MASKFKSSVEIDGYLSVSSGNWIQVPDGTTAQRPGSPAVGMLDIILLQLNLKDTLVQLQLGVL